MPVVHHRTRHTAAAGATLALALAGLVAPVTAASAAEAVAVKPTTPAAGSAFEVAATGLTAGVTYNVVLTAPGDANKTSVAESTTCTAGTDGKTKTCLIREDTPGTYDIKLFGANDVKISSTPVTVATPVAITSATTPKANDNAGTADSITITHIKGVQWQTSVDNGTKWEDFSFANDAAEGTKRDFPVSSPKDGSIDVQVKAVAKDGYVIPAGAPSYTLRLTGTTTPPAALTISSAAQPVKTDNVGLGDDRLTLTKVDGVDWVVAGTKITFAAGETSKTITVAPKEAEKYVVAVQAQAVAPNSFSGGRLAEDFNQTYSDVKADPTSDRVAGDNRELTAVGVAKKYFSPGVEAVYVANGYNFPDALSAGPAAARAKSPLLLAGKNWINDATLEEVKRLAPKRVFLVGGADVVDNGVATKLSAIAPVTRVAGGTRYTTAVEVAGQWSAANTVYIAYGLNFPDALSGGSGAAKEGAPLLLSDGDGLSAETAAAIKRLGAKKVVLVGGPDVLTPAVERAVRDVVPSVDLVRAGGVDRYDTAALIIKNVTGADKPKSAFVATGLNYPDALAGVPAAAVTNSPLALTQRNCVPSSVKAELDKLPLEKVTRLGGSNVVGDFSLVHNVCS